MRALLTAATLLLSACTAVGLYHSRLSIENLYDFPLQASYTECWSEQWQDLGTIPPGKRKTVDVDPGCYSVKAVSPNGSWWTIDIEVKEGATFVAQWRPWSE